LTFFHRAVHVRTWTAWLIVKLTILTLLSTGLRYDKVALPRTRSKFRKMIQSLFLNRGTSIFDAGSPMIRSIYPATHRNRRVNQNPDLSDE
jgi:hypothetical protein